MSLSKQSGQQVDIDLEKMKKVFSNSLQAMAAVMSKEDLDSFLGSQGLVAQANIPDWQIDMSILKNENVGGTYIMSLHGRGPKKNVEVNLSLHNKEHRNISEAKVFTDNPQLLVTKLANKVAEMITKSGVFVV